MNETREQLRLSDWLIGLKIRKGLTSLTEFLQQPVDGRDYIMLAPIIWAKSSVHQKHIYISRTLNVQCISAQVETRSNQQWSPVTNKSETRGRPIWTIHYPDKCILGRAITNHPSSTRVKHFLGLPTPSVIFRRFALSSTPNCTPGIISPQLHGMIHPACWHCTWAT